MIMRKSLSAAAGLLLCLCAVLTSCYAQDAAVLYNQSRFNKTIELYRRAADAGDYDGYCNLAVVLKDLGHYRQAIRVLNAAASKFPQDRAILMLLGRIHFLNNDPQHAVPVLEQILLKDPGDVEALLTLGLCYEATGFAARAGDLLRR
ncbi:MAG: tetratricopeptide repeat protein, partial [Candidatus Omnitrophota bacterium]